MVHTRRRRRDALCHHSATVQDSIDDPNRPALLPASPFPSIGSPQTIRAGVPAYFSGFQARSMRPDNCHGHGRVCASWRRRSWRDSPTTSQKARVSAGFLILISAVCIPYVYPWQGNASRPSNNRPTRRSHSPLLGAPCPPPTRWRPGVVGWFNCGSLIRSSVLDGRRCSIKGRLSEENRRKYAEFEIYAHDPKRTSLHRSPGLCHC
jgi:hypothetical protein